MDFDPHPYIGSATMHFLILLGGKRSTSQLKAKGPIPNVWLLIRGFTVEICTSFMRTWGNSLYTWENSLCTHSAILFRSCVYKRVKIFERSHFLRGSKENSYTHLRKVYSLSQVHKSREVLNPCFEITFSQALWENLMSTCEKCIFSVLSSVYEISEVTLSHGQYTWEIFLELLSSVSRKQKFFFKKSVSHRHLREF